MGSPVDGSWTDFSGAYYVGAGSGMEIIWVFASVGLCVLALIIGAAHEGSSYRKSKRR